MLFSLITVAYNSEATIERTIKSILSQNDNDFEYIIIDGVSSDNTIKIIRQYSSTFNKRAIKLTVISEPDFGIYDAMNKGIKIASGDYICLINSDDWLEPNALELVADEIKSKNPDFIYGDINIIKNNSKKIIKKSKLMKHYISSRYWSHPSSYISKKLYESVGLYKNETIYDDFDLVLRIFKSNAKISVINKPLANFTMNGVSHKKGLKAAFQRANLKYSVYRKNGYSRIYWFECYFLEILKAIIR